LVAPFAHFREIRALRVESRYTRDYSRGRGWTTETRQGVREERAMPSTKPYPAVHLVESSAAELRLSAAESFVEAHAKGPGVLLVGASRGAVDDLARAIAANRGATVGLHRFSLTQLAAWLAAPVLAQELLAPTGALASDAVAARAAFDARSDGALQYFLPVANMPGFPKALARTLQEMRLARVPGDALGRLPLGGRDLADLLTRFDRQFADASATDRASLFDAATRAVFAAPLASLPLLLLDVPFDSAVEFGFVETLIAVPRSSLSGPRVLITVPFGDLATLRRLKTLGLEPDIEEQKGESDLVALRRNLFAERQPPERDPTGEVVLFSAPGEGRECIEIARRILQEAARGVRFDDMAVLLRAPEGYTGLLEHALARAGVPAYFDRGARRPNPAGRAFLAILACAQEKLSARRFAEYLSLAQVPRLDGRARIVDDVVPDDEVFVFRQEGERAPEDEQSTEAASSGALPDEDDDAIVEGALRAPWRWESLIVESSVIGGDARRWHRRLKGLEQQYILQRAAERKEDPESPVAARIDRDLANLRHLERFALPIIDRIAAWPAKAMWGDWLGRFIALAPQVLRVPDRVVAVLRQLAPMSAIGPVSLDEARGVLAERLQGIEDPPLRTRYGRLFVGTPHQVRGRVFRVVFVPGLAERMFPQRPHEDPMLLDREMRSQVGAGLVTQAQRIEKERLLLRLAAGAPSERLWISYPRIELGESRPRVPSTYALDVMRAITGRVPKHDDLQRAAAEAGGSGLAWPAPGNAADAIDDLEHDLAVLRELLQVDPPSKVRGHAHYLLKLNANLRRSVMSRWGRAKSTWTQFDGITRVTGTIKPMLDAQRLTSRTYSLSALQKFASCPYQFLLSAVYRLEPPPDINPLQKLDPLTRGSIFHDCQARFFRALKETGSLPVTASTIDAAVQVMDAAVAEIASKYRENLAPAIDRVWRDEIDDIARDLRVWVRRLPGTDGWTPAYFEYAFGLHDVGRDPHSAPDPVLIDGRFLLRGSVDLIEQRSLPAKAGSHGDASRGHGDATRGFRLQAGKELRVTDHKTGKNRTTWKTIIGGGRLLQPVLYSMAVERALGAPVISGRLFYCTSAGGFVDHEIPINDVNRRTALEALEIIDRAVELGFLPAAPDEKACTWCDFRPVCGPGERDRTQRKVQDKLGDLEALRALP
jgi:CRISPR/Cas system-associated exonuclease Cas4 (RecB family)